MNFRTASTTKLVLASSWTVSFADQRAFPVAARSPAGHTPVYPLLRQLFQLFTRKGESYPSPLVEAQGRFVHFDPRLSLNRFAQSVATLFKHTEIISESSNGCYCL